MPATVSYVVDRKQNGKLVLKGDLERTAFSIPVIDYKKTSGVPGSLLMTLNTVGGDPVRISDLRVHAGDAVLEGDIAFGKKGWWRASFSRVALGDTDVSLTAEKAPGDAYDVKIRGRQVDLTPIMESDNKPGARRGVMEKASAVTVTMDVGRLITGKDATIDQARVFLRRDEWQRIQQVEMDGKVASGAVFLRYMPVPGGHSLRFEADNAGTALGALGLGKSVRGGKLSITGAPLPGGGERDIGGTVIMTDFTLVNVPVLARLLNALSLPGFLNLLDGKGISFKKMRSDFAWYDRRTPIDDKDVRLLKLKNGQTSGSSLGLTFEGTVDNWNNIYDLNGTIIPISDISKIISAVPIIGNVLTAGGEGIFAATYSINGPKDQPSILVNPLSVLAPGVLRKLFFEE